VGTGTNETTNLCAAIAAAAVSNPTLADAAIACKSGTGYACTYNTGNHTVTCPARTRTARPVTGAWDVGAYQYSAGSIEAPPSRSIQRLRPLPLVCMNPLPRGLVERLVSDGISIYGKDGRKLSPNQIKQDGVYIFRDKKNSRAQRVVVLK
jgi:hypothetical protein